MTLLERLRHEEDALRGHADLLADVADRLREIAKELERLALHRPLAPAQQARLDYLNERAQQLGGGAPSSVSEDRA